jgi:hypothetical protein
MLLRVPKLDSRSLLFFALCLLASGCGKREDTSKDILANFAREREREARAISETESTRWPPEVAQFFKAAEDGHWDQATNLYATLQNKYVLAPSPPTNGWGGFMVKSYAGLGRHGLTPTNYWPDPSGPQWRPVDDIYFAIYQFQHWDPGLLRFYATNIIESIPTNSIFISGQDSGFFAIPAFCKSLPKGDRFITLTPNKLVDENYLKYADEIYGKAIHIPTEADMSDAYSDYVADVTQRARSAQLKPGEVFTNTAAGPTIGGDIAIMQINALLFWGLFSNNPGREFYYEERWPLDWTTPYLVPHGLIFKINPAPLFSFDAAIVDRDRIYWHVVVRQLTGLDKNEDLLFPRLSDFAEQIYLRKDFSRFRGDLHFATNIEAQITFAKSRISIARVYAWRVDNSAGSGDRQRMSNEADLAFRQAFALDPRLPELAQYGAFLFSLHRTNDLQSLAEVIQKINPGGSTSTYLSALVNYHP